MSQAIWRSNFQYAFIGFSLHLILPERAGARVFVREYETAGESVLCLIHDATGTLCRSVFDANFNLAKSRYVCALNLNKYTNTHISLCFQKIFAPPVVGRGHLVICFFFFRIVFTNEYSVFIIACVWSKRVSYNILFCK